MSDAFLTYESEFLASKTSLGRVIESLPRENGERRKVTLKKAENDLMDLDSLVQQMDLEVRSLPSNKKAARAAKVKTYKDDVVKIRADLRRVAGASAVAAARSDLLDPMHADVSEISANQRQRVLNSNARLEKTSNDINRIHSTALESEEIGNTILSDLAQQRQVILRAKDTVQESNQNVDEARGILNSMGRRIVTNKIILMGIILLILGSLGLILYFRYS
eukprot:TRINITY_DN14366_c0_g1_i1.p1 TRINITY_DN14366_c0_g1~~TRINITY_DN14366_c0_g1_i1.p1  ORF type:complete len:221 (-),score=61.04 TRINITY_DN14366_c0_g1_i1:326-988(-)